MRLGHSVPRADQTTVVFSPRNSEYLGREQPVSEQMVVRARVSPGSPLDCSWPSWYAGWCASQRHTLGLEDQSKPIYRTVSHVFVGMGAGAWKALHLLLGQVPHSGDHRQLAGQIWLPMRLEKG